MMKKPLKNKDEQLKLTTLAFTLIELLAVIVLLGVIAMLVYPSVNDALTDSKKKAFKLSVTGIFNSVESDNANSDFAIDSKYVYNNGILTKVKENGRMLDSSVVVKTKGKLTDGNGTVVIDNEGNIIVKIDNQKWCGYNDKTNKNIEIMDGTCEGLTNPDNITPEYCFNFNKITGTITGYNYNGLECDADVVIPDIIDDIVVQHIGYAAFIDGITYQECYDYDGNWHEVDSSFVHYEGDGYEICYIEADNSNPITSVVLPENIISIKDWSFSYNNLTNLTLNNLSNLVTIDFCAFYHNQLMGLTLTNLPQLTTIGYGAFYETQINNLDLNDLPQLTTIEYGAFLNNQITNLTLTNLPQLTTIGMGAFAENQLTELTLENLPNLSIIGDGAFNNNQITELTLSDLPNLNIIGEWSFEKNQLEEITLNNLPSLTSIGYEAFLKGYEPSISNLNLSKIINKTNNAYEWSSITGSHTTYEVQIFETGTIIHQDGNIEVVLE